MAEDQAAYDEWWDYVPNELLVAYEVLRRSPASAAARLEALGWARRHGSFAGCPYLDEGLAIAAEAALPWSAEWFKAVWDRRTGYVLTES